MSVALPRRVRSAFPRDRPFDIDTAAAATLLALSICVLALGLLTLARNGADVASVPFLAVFSGALLSVTIYVRRRSSGWPSDLARLTTLSVACLIVVLLLPDYLYGYSVNGILHRSLFSSAALIGLGTASISSALGRLCGSAPSAADNARYTYLALPIGLAFTGYAVLLSRLVGHGTGGLGWHTLTTAYTERLQDAAFVREAGLRNQVLGTFLLIGMTSIIALPPGVGAGVFMNEYPGRLAHVVRFSTTMLRAISPFLIGVAAFALVQYASHYPAGNPLSDFVRGSYRDAAGFKHAAKGSFLAASVFLSLLVIPVIARATEEGLRSVPREIREGSVALGATEGHGMLRILLPWAAPNIVTGLLLGAAEAAGSVAVLLLIAGTGQNGVGPLKEPTSLAFAIFETHYGPKAFHDSMSQYQYTAALLLLMLTLGLTIVALFLKGRLSKRYRGSLTSV